MKQRRNFHELNTEARVDQRKTFIWNDAVVGRAIRRNRRVLNHRDNYSLVVLFPYKLINGELQYGEAFAPEGERDVLIVP